MGAALQAIQRGLHWGPAAGAPSEEEMALLRDIMAHLPRQGWGTRHIRVLGQGIDMHGGTVRHGTEEAMEDSAQGELEQYIAP